jgi:uncharacterized protein (TIGR02145 family)
MIMGKNNIYFAAVAALLALAGCNKASGPETAVGITVKASIGQMTRVQYTGNATEFTTGDQIAVYAWTGSASAVPANPVVNGEVNTFDGSAWTPAHQMAWDGSSEAHFFLGVCPAKTISDFTADSYSLEPADYTASDLLIATRLDGLTPSATPVDLTFTHAMAKLTVNLRFLGQTGSTPVSADVTVTARKTATVNYLTKTVTATGDATNVALPDAAAAPAGYVLSYSGLQVPQTGVNEVIVNIGGQEYRYQSTDDIPLQGGKNTILSLVIGHDIITLDVVSVSDWTADEDLPGGVAYLHEWVDMGEVTIGGVTKHLLWATCNVGADYPWDFGNYFAWGETVPKGNYNWDSYSLGDGTSFSKYTGSDYVTLQAEDDAATANWGAPWHIPTDQEWETLFNDALYSWVWTRNYMSSGINGMLVTRKQDDTSTDPCAGHSIFLPVTGYWDQNGFKSMSPDASYWSSSLCTESLSYAWLLEFNRTGHFEASSALRRRGLPVRPVIEYI